MKGLVLVLMLTLVGCQHQNKQPVFSQDKCYTYKYELQQVTRVAPEWYSGVGIKLLCKVDICGSGSGLLLIQIYSPEVYEYKTNSPTPKFIPSPKLTNSFEAKLGKHAAFRLQNGRITKIMAPANHSVDSLNIYKGFLNIMQLTIKDKKSEYTLQEDGIEGLCNARYTIPDSMNANRMLVMKVKNLNDCLNRVEKIVGAIYAVPCTECKENSQAAVTSSYFIKPTREGPVIDQVDVVETHQYMPFNGINGARIVMEARQNIQLIKVEQHSPEKLPANFKDCGSLALQFSEESQQLSTPVKQLEHQIMDDLQYLAQHTRETISRDCTKKFQRLTQNMHKADYELYDSVYKTCSSESACRRIFWDVIASADSPSGIKFLKHKYEQQEVTGFEVAQIVIISFHYSNPSLEVIEEAKSLLTVVHQHTQHPHGYLFRTVFLAYASLCHKYCIALNTCPESALKPVTDFESEVLSSPNEDDIILLLRVYENLQHESIKKAFKKFLPGFSTFRFPLRVQHVALLCLKSFAKKDATWVRETSMQIFLNYKLHPSTRIVAVMSLLSANPGLPALMILAKSLANEPSTQVEHFVISTLTTLATSTAPDLQVIASASRMVLNIVSSKSEWPKYATGKFFLLSFYKESLMADVTTEVFILSNEGSAFPNFMSTRFEISLLRNKFSPLEVGIGISNLAEILLSRRHETDSDNGRSHDARKDLKMSSDQKVMPHEASIVGGYVQMFGQNIIMAATDAKTFVEACKELYSPERNYSWITNVTYSLKRGVAIQWVKALTSVDASYAVAVGTGLPLERSLTHVAITSFAGNAKASFTPELPQNHKLSSSSINDIRIKSKWYLSIVKHMNFSMGTQTTMIQTYLEEYAKLTVNLPINADVAVNIKNQSFKLKIPPCKEETDIFSLSTRTFAVVGNGEDASATNSTAVLPPQKNMIMDWNFKSYSESDNKLKERPYSKPNSPRSTSSAEQCGHQSAQVHEYLNTSTFGFQTCIKYSAVHAGLSNVILNHNMTCTLYPVHSEPPVESIQVNVQLNGDPKTVSRTEKPKNKNQTNFLGDRVSPSLTFEAQAIRSNNKKEGYQVKVYYEHKPNMLDMQLVMDDLNDNNQTVCLYMDAWRYKAKVGLSMENQCQYKNLDIEVSKGHLERNPAIQVKIKSKKLPEKLKSIAFRAEELLPSLAAQYGFHSIWQSNPSQELVVGVVASSPRSVSVICKLPEKTLYKEGLNVPWTLLEVLFPHYPHKELPDLNFLKNVALWLHKEDEAECQVEETSIRTFDNKRFNSSFNENHGILIAKECTEKPQFSIATRKPKLDLPREVYIHLTSGNITISPASNSSIHVSYNGEAIDKDTYEDNKAGITIYKHETTVLIKAPQHGLENVTYDCEMLWITVSATMRGKTCGLCGNNDGEQQNDHEPNHTWVNNSTITDRLTSGGETR